MNIEHRRSFGLGCGPYRLWMQSLAVACAGLLGTGLIGGGLVGCEAGPKPVASVAAPPERKAHLVQLNDRYWADTAQARSITFGTADPAAVANGSAPYFIRFWNIGSTDPFDFTFSDKASAVAAWKQLVQQLGGTLHDQDWDKHIAAHTAEADAKPLKESPGKVVSSESSASDDLGDYSVLHQDTVDLEACRDEKFITESEFDTARRNLMVNFIKIVGYGNQYNAVYGRLRLELTQLDKAGKQHLLNDSELATMHATILARYSITNH